MTLVTLLETDNVSRNSVCPERVRYWQIISAEPKNPKAEMFFRGLVSRWHHSKKSRTVKIILLIMHKQYSTIVLRSLETNMSF